jgi:hypothetical protein
MFVRRGKLALVSAMCVMASSAFTDPGAFESFVRQLHIRALQDAGYAASASAEVVEQSANCYATFVAQGFTSDELRRLDAYASGGPALGEVLASKMLTRPTDPQAAQACK